MTLEPNFTAGSLGRITMKGLQQNSWVEGPVFAKELCPEPRGLRAMAQASA
jgi:hypothetical protein